MQLFLRGVVLPFQKGKTLERGIEEMTVSQVRVPIAPGDAANPIAHLEAGTPVACGGELCRNDGMPVVSSVSGTIEGTVVTNHPLYGSLLCADIEVAGEAEERMTVVPEEELTPELILQIAKEAAIYDELDGIPLWQKLQQWTLPENDPAALHSLLVADATENDIFGSSAWAVLMEQPKLVLFGLQMAAKAIRFNRYHIATMLPKRRRRTLKRAIGRVNVYTVGDEYPVTAFADRDVETYRIGVQACLALGRALKQGLRHTAAIVTVAGDALPAPRNMRVPFGTRLSELLTACQAKQGYRLILGDSMMGVNCPDPNTPLWPGITTVLAMQPRGVRIPGPCIGCGRCADVCHADLLPYEIVRRSENMHYERLRHLSPTDCDGCGACSYVCPAGRNVATEVLRAGQSNGLFLNWEEDDDE
ncbi:MAG: 4Fe-4S dicluster domain-containing protein [Ruminococcaceae bacterium]|nr:4Fe-4S dicluster domain-containing protein [Oscillospiraceae bacterium]